MTEETTPERVLERGAYLQALALFTMADAHYRQLRAFENQLTKLLGVTDFGHVSDAIYSEEGGAAVPRLAEALAREGITIEAEPTS